MDNLPKEMDDREKWRERVSEIHTSGTPRLYIYIYIYIYIYMCVCVCVCVCVCTTSKFLSLGAEFKVATSVER